MFGVNLSVALFDAGRREAARWTAERARAEAERAAMIQTVHAQIAGAREVLALRQTAVVTAGPSSSDDLTRVAEVAFREGEIGIFELLDALRAVARARLRDIELRLGARQAQIALERAAGDTLWP
jgi:outer membrane protein TolC